MSSRLRKPGVHRRLPELPTVVTEARVARGTRLRKASARQAEKTPKPSAARREARKAGLGRHATMTSWERKVEAHRKAQRKA